MTSFELTLALPAVLILDPQGRLAWQYVAANVMDRPDEEQVIAALRAVRPICMG